jgi:hypothetical protein
MDRYFDPGAGSERSRQDGDEPDPFALGDDAADDDEGDEEESSSFAYGSLMSLGGSLRKKQPCIVIDADEAEQGIRLVQHAASHQFGVAEDADVALPVDVALPSHDWQAERETKAEIASELEPETVAKELPLAPAALEPSIEAEFAAEEPDAESTLTAEAMPLLPSSEPESIDDFRLAPPPVFEYRNGLRRKLVAAQATATPGLRLVQLLHRIRRWAMRLRF